MLCMSTIDPPFHADHVGSLLRPPTLLAARQQCADGTITAAELRKAEDVAIADTVAKLESIGMRSVTDGEFRRTWFHLDFLEHLDGVRGHGQHRRQLRRRDDRPPDTAEAHRGRPAAAHARHPGRRLPVPRVGGHQTPKVAIPSPTMVHFHGGRAGIDIDAYPTSNSSSPIWRRCIEPRSTRCTRPAAGTCSSTTPTSRYLCDPVMRDGAVDAGDDPDALPHAYAELINAAIGGRPDDLTARVAIHLCRGNYRSTWFAQGGAPVAEVLFNELDVDAYFLEYDDERSGDFAPLRHVPADKTVVLGLVTSKRPSSSRTTSWRHGSTKRASTRRSTSSASARNAASPARSRATPSPRTSSGPSSPTSSTPPPASGAEFTTDH